jgi:aminoglycoside phosphotransferase (APT) family kinase protein
MTALAGWLAERLGVDTVVLSEFERAPAGQSSDTRLFTASWDGGRRDLVLRGQPSGGIFLTPDVVREARVLAALEHGSRVPVPHVIGWDTDPAVVGKPFFVMDKVDGRVPAAKPSPHAVGWMPMLTAGERTTMWESAIDVLVAIHDVDWRATHAFLIEGGDAAFGLSGHIDRLVEWYAWTTKGREFPITDAALQSVTDRRDTIDAGDPVLVWGDARPGNMIFGADHRCAAAIDWEVVTIGAAGIDLGHWLFFDAFATTACGVERLSGWPDRDATVARYEALSGRRVADLEFFELLEELFIATTLIRQADMRVERGVAPPDTRMGHDNAVTQMLARRLGLPVPDLSPDYLAHRAV